MRSRIAPSCHTIEVHPYNEAAAHGCFVLHAGRLNPLTLKPFPAHKSVVLQPLALNVNSHSSHGRASGHAPPAGEQQMVPHLQHVAATMQEGWPHKC